MSHVRKAVLDGFRRMPKVHFRFPDEPGGPGEGGGGGNDPPEDPPEPPKKADGVAKVYTQDEVDQMIANRLSREQKKLQKKVVLEPEDYERLQQAEAAATQAAAEKKKHDEEEAKKRGEYERLLAERDTRIQELDARLTQTQTTERQKRLENTRQSAIEMALNRFVAAEAIWPDAIGTAKAEFGQFVKIDPETERPYVVDETGAAVEDVATGQPLPVAAAMEKWLQKRPFLLRTGKHELGGSGSQTTAPAPGVGGGDGDLKAVNGKKPVRQADGTLVFYRSDLRNRDGSVDTEFMKAYGDEIKAAQREGRILDDLSRPELRRAAGA